MLILCLSYFITTVFVQVKKHGAASKEKKDAKYVTLHDQIFS